MNILVPYFNVNGRGSYPAGVHTVGDELTFNGTDYLICIGNDYAETGPDKYADLTPPEVSLTIEGDKAYGVMTLGETINFTATFSDLTINASIPVSIVNRENVHAANALVTIKDGIGTGTFTPDKALDYFVTEAAINFHTAALDAKLILAEPFLIRVVQS